jgi:hypothetical protein
MRRNGQQRPSASTKAATRSRVRAAARKRSTPRAPSASADTSARARTAISARRAGISAAPRLHAIGGRVVMAVACTFKST